MARRSVPPKPSKGLNDQLEELFRRLGKPDPDLLAALLDGVSEAQLRDREQNAPPTPELLARAVSDVGKAYEHWQRLSVEQRRKLRGISIPLFAVAVDQARHLVQLHAQHERNVAEHEEAKAREQKLILEAQQVCAQTKGLLLKVAGGRPSIQIALNEKVADANSPYAMICNLKYLAEASKSLIQLPAPAVRGRALLYGMDRAFVESLNSLAEELRAEDEKVAAHPSKLPGRDSMGRARAMLWSLLNHIAEVFSAAHNIDPSTPVLRPVTAGAPSGVMPAQKVEGVTEAEAKRKAALHKLHIPRLR
jgi:hypothetical protein